MRWSTLAMFAAVPACARSTAVPPPITDRGSGGPTYAYVGGSWFDGQRFVAKPMYSVGGIFTNRAPAVVDSSLNLAGGFVVPPFGDAHTHNLDGPFNLDSTRARYLREGTFYVQVLTNVASRTAAVRARFNRPCDLDVAYANGGITSTLSHPFLAYEPRAIASIPRGADWAPYAGLIRQSRILLGDAYWFVDSPADLDSAWPRILSARPDIIKIFLLDAMEHPPAMPDTGLPAGHGLRPSLVAPIVERAHAAGLRVAAHVETAEDARIAIEAGVDLLAHLPGYGMPDAEDLAGIARRLRLQARNITLLRRAGAVIAVGSDQFGRTATGEFEEFVKLGLLVAGGAPPAPEHRDVEGDLPPAEDRRAGARIRGELSRAGVESARFARSDQ